MLFLAMSCLQGRPQMQAYLELLSLGPDGLQLTPGNLPSPGFRAFLRGSPLALRVHDGFAWDAYRAPVFDAGGRILERHEGIPWSLHPPEAACSGGVPDGLEAFLDDAAGRPVIVETMFPGHLLGTGREIDRAMERGALLAVDIAHLHLQEAAGALDAATRRRLEEYEWVAEIHVSASTDRSDAHLPLAPGTPGLAWARERMRAGTPVVLECHMHRLDAAGRRRQVDLVRGGRA